MSTLDQQLVITCPLAQAASRLTHFFKMHGNTEDDTARFVLRADVDVAGLPSSRAFERAVTATMKLHHLPADMTPRYNVKWAPEKPGPFPDFDGELFVESADDYDTFRLRLSGAYTPPFGLVGQGFDAVVGHRIAQATALDLLQRIKTVVEREFEEDEERKRLVRKEQLDAR